MFIDRSPTIRDCLIIEYPVHNSVTGEKVRAFYTPRLMSLITSSERIRFVRVYGCVD